jgi:putative oxidoreductase
MSAFDPKRTWAVQDCCPATKSVNPIPLVPNPCCNYIAWDDAADRRGSKSTEGCAMADSQAKLLYPGLSGFYETVLPIAETFVRIVIGIMFLMHVSGKFAIGPSAVAANFAKIGLEPAILWAYVVIFFESVGGVCLIIGLFTRFFAAALAIEMLVALLVVHMPKGYAASGGGYEYVLLIGAACFLIAIRGGGPYSIDRFIGKEL